MSHDLMVCVHCRRPVAYRFTDVSYDVGLYFHWVKNWYFVDVVQFIEDKPWLLFRESWFLVAKGAERP